VKDRVRDVGWETFVESVWRDVGYAARGLGRAPGFTAVASLTLALGIGANTAIFTLLDVAALRSLPVQDPEQLVALQYEYRGRSQSIFSYPHFERLRENTRALSGLFAVSGLPRLNLVVDGRADIATGTLVSGDYFRVLGVAPHLGRLLTVEDDRTSNAVAVVSHGFWRSRFGADPGIVGRAVTVNGVPVAIVGVAPPGFFGVIVGAATDVMLPLRLSDRVTMNRGWWNQPFVTWLQMVGKVGPGISREAARVELAGIFRQSQLEFTTSSNDPDMRASASTLQLESAAAGLEGRVHAFTPALRFLMVIAAIVLLIACANIANLYLARGDARQRETAIRLAIGASRSRLMRQLLTESALVGAIGSALGCVLALWGSRALSKMVATGPIPILLDTTPDLRVLGFTALVSCVTVLLFGTAPALHATRTRRPLASFSARAIGTPRIGWNRALVVAQITLSLVLVLAAGLSWRTVDNLLATETGYDRRDVLMFSTDASLLRYDGTRAPAVYAGIRDTLSTLPGVQHASASMVRPIDSDAYLVGSVGFIDGRTLTRDARIRYAFNVLGLDYFSTLRIPLIRGRDFGPHDGATSPKVAIINETMARHVFPGTNALGHRFGQNDREALEVIGVVRDTKYANLLDAPRAVMYLPMSQTPWSTQVSFLLRHEGSVESLIDSVRQRMTAIDPNLPMYRVNTLDTQARESLLRQRLLARVSGLLGGVALLLAAVGLYGLMSFAVAQRVKEIGVRMALGADRRRVVWMTLAESLRLIGFGIVIGVPTSVAVMRLAKSLLFGLTPGDPITLALVVALLSAVAVAAAYLPARRAARVDPMVALRVD
jgi:predicted permease